MGIPLEYHVLLMMLSIVFFLLILLLLFVKPDFYRSIGAMILVFLCVPISYITCQGFFAIDLYGYDTDGVVVSNLVSEYSELGFIFICIAYICLILFFYIVYLLYEKPWDATRKVEGNPYVYYQGKSRY